MAKQTLTGSWSLLNSKGMFAPEGIKVIRGRNAKAADGAVVYDLCAIALK